MSAQPGRVLVVDDESALRDVAHLVLSEAGYAVTDCANGREALEALEQEAFDAVLSDVRMPDMDGLSLLRALRDRDLDLPVVLWTGGPSIEAAAEAVEYGALQYLIKPVPTEKLIEVIGRAVKLGSLARLKRKALVATGFDQLVGDRAGLEGSFARALAGIWMAYQPIVRAADGSTYAREALLRTTESVFPNPGVLLTAAERLGRLPDLGQAIRASVANALASSLLNEDVFVNLHPLDLADPSLFDHRAPLSHFAKRIVLEVTERSSLESVADASDRIAELRRMGYRIAIDDLGAGYAGLTNFVVLSPQVVKIDMSLVRGLDGDVVKQKLVASITALCQDLEILVVAEGIETEGERAAAAHAGCELLQGFLFGRPTGLA